MISIQPPTNCPSCFSVLAWSNNLVYCRNTLCPAQTSKKVEHFAKTLKIKGLGPSAVSKLGLTYIDDIYNLSLADIAEGLSSVKLAEKLYTEIQHSKKATLNELLPAFSIPLVGKTASSKLSTIIYNLNEITLDKCREAGLGEKTASNLMDWFHDEWKEELEFLPFSFQFDTSFNSGPGNLGVLCISGKLKSFPTKADATNLLTQMGYVVKSTVTKDVTILVNETGVESTKTLKARKAGLTIVTNLQHFLNHGELNGTS